MGDTEAVFIFAPDGRFVSRFGNVGDEPGQFRAPYAIAVDGQSRVYVSDFKVIQVFDPQGRYPALIDLPTPGVAFGLVFNDRNELLASPGTGCPSAASLLFTLATIPLSAIISVITLGSDSP